MNHKKPHRRLSILFGISLFAIGQATSLFVNADISAESNQPMTERRVNNGNLILQDVPEIPHSIVNELTRFQNVRYGSFLDWTADGGSIYIRTRFSDTPQIHKVDAPSGARKQMTFFREPIGSANRQPTGDKIVYTMDAGGSEYAQIFLLDPATADSTMLSDGESVNSSVVWDTNGKHIAFRSTRRNGKSNDLWMMNIDKPGEARMILESPDGTSWSPIRFDSKGKYLLIRNYVSVVDSRLHLLDLASGKLTLLAGGENNKSINYGVGFDLQEDAFYFLTDQQSEFIQLAKAPLADPADITIITAAIPWNVTRLVLSQDRRRGAFVVNNNGIDELFLLDTKTQKYKAVDGLPIGLIGKASFSPDSRGLAMTLNTPKTPSDTYVLALGKRATDAGKLTQWTSSEVGGLNTEDFIKPELIAYPSFDDREIPAFVYTPKTEGPHPVIISIHGGPEGQSRPSFSSTYQMWVKKLNAAVIVPNVRGSNGYGKSYLQLDNGFKREDSVKDIGALLDWIETQPNLDAGRVIVYGGSYGGYMVLASAVHYSNRLKAAVDVVGISNFVTFLKNTKDYRRDLRRVEYGDERDPAMYAHLQAISPLNNIEKITIPLLVVQGENDPRVPVTESTQLVQALRDQEQTVWYLNALNEGHGYRKKENRDVYQQVTIMFLQQFL
ncbi:MAG: prolyl oligopeptidase family serine peptidase [Pseudomonadales bacterium]|nr:prolyl oligopeptidase family serine peptidase [Pseudomonadales bacterium]MDG1441887.1 prolyl oligopeptidase family serine peptidase [Pseudomonadales bacterium]